MGCVVRRSGKRPTAEAVVVVVMGDKLNRRNY